jgi:pyruvate dehydrogenase E2 component (dihydrolipoamide acetyltransferase)
MYGLEAFTAIINPPQCAILAIGAIGVELCLDAGAVRERRVLKATLSADHRVVDGALAARFLSELKTVLENPACVLEGSEPVGNHAVELDGGRVQSVHDAR